MRIKKTIDLGENRLVTVKELRVKDVRYLLANAQTFEGLDFKTLLGERFGEVASLLSGCFEFPCGEDLDDLSGSELLLVAEGFKEVNAAFLGLVGMAPADVTDATTEPLTNSTAPASS